MGLSPKSDDMPLDFCLSPRTKYGIADVRLKSALDKGVTMTWLKPRYQIVGKIEEEQELEILLEIFGSSMCRGRILLID